jgi:hypothetical protein
VDADGVLWISDNSGGSVIRYPTSAFPSQDEFTTIDVSSIYGITADFNGFIWAAGQDGSIRRIDPADNSVESWATEFTYFSGTTVDINNRLWFCADGQNSLIRFDQITKETVQVDLGVSPHGVGADDAGFVYSVNWHDDSASKVDAETGEVILTYKVGSAPYTYSDLTGFIYRKVTLQGK